jgi:hypothetical protein
VEKSAQDEERQKAKAHGKWQKREQQMCQEDQQAVLIAWEAKCRALRERGVKRMLEKPKIQKLFPLAPTPNHLKAAKKTRRTALNEELEENNDASGCKGSDEE